MISYEIFCRLRHLHDVDNLTMTQIARELSLNESTVRKWIGKGSCIRSRRRASRDQTTCSSTSSMTRSAMRVLCWSCGAIALFGVL